MDDLAAELAARLEALEVRLAGLEAENERLRTENRALRDRVARLEAEAARDSNNSSKPPSGDSAAARKKRAERRAEERQAAKAEKKPKPPGKQPGAPGASLRRRTPDVMLVRPPVACSCCGTDLADAPVVGTEVRQVIDLPAIEPVVSDHVIEKRRCACGTVTAGEFPPEARAPVCFGPEVRAFAVYLMVRQHVPIVRCAELLQDVLGVTVSAGWLCQVQLEAAGRLGPFIGEVKDRLRAAPVIHADETGTRVGVTCYWVHVASTNLLTLLAVHRKRGAEALHDIDVLPGYAGTIVHDGWTPYETIDGAGTRHAQCGSHLLRHLADELARKGFEVSSRTVLRLLHRLGYSLQANAKVTEGRQHQDRDAQFRYLNDMAEGFLDDDQPVISVDTKKKELVGDFANGGSEWQPSGKPEQVRVHDFADPVLGKVVPYGIYDIANNEGWVNVGDNADTAEFAVNSIRRWWDQMGRTRFPNADRLLITADGGGSNGYRLRAWKTHLAALAAETGLRITVCHYPPGTSKWNRIEHRMFSFITINWRGKPLETLRTVIELISATTTNTGLTIHADHDPATYTKGIKITDSELAAIPLHPHDWHGEWNYTINAQPDQA